jgi:transcriptional regulator with XRE-family HTH domain
MMRAMPEHQVNTREAGLYLTRKRTERGVSKLRLEQKTGISNSYIGQIETGFLHVRKDEGGGRRPINPSEYRLLALADALDFTPAEKREFLELWGYTYRGEILSGLGNPHDLTLEELRELRSALKERSAVVDAVIRERERAERIHGAIPTTATTPSAAATDQASPEPAATRDPQAGP